MPPSNRNIRARLSRGWKFGRSRPSPHVLCSRSFLIFHVTGTATFFFQAIPIASAFHFLPSPLLSLPSSFLYILCTFNAFSFIYTISSVNFDRLQLLQHFYIFFHSDQSLKYTIKISYGSCGNLCIRKKFVIFLRMFLKNSPPE